MKTARLLLVDDNQDNLDILTVILAEKYQVSSYACAREALAALEATKPDLLVLDIGMTPVDGVECLKAIRAMPGYGSIPAIALTAYALDAERKAFLAAGFQAVVTKPIADHDKFFAEIAKSLTAVPAPSHDRPVTDPGYEPLGRGTLTRSTEQCIIAHLGFGNPVTPRPAG
jgi:CheY-like chemotaxis protein